MYYKTWISESEDRQKLEANSFVALFFFCDEFILESKAWLTIIQTFNMLFVYLSNSLLPLELMKYI